MKKIYNAPSVKAFNLTTANILAVSGGVTNKSLLGNSYNDDDVSYGKGADWDDEDEE